MKRIILGSLLGLASCASVPTYDHPTKTPEQFEEDKATCVQYASQVNDGMGLGFNPLFIQSETRRCLERKGWERQ